MSALRFTEEHEWLRPDNDGTVTIGITDYAQQQLGDVVYVELPEIGKQVQANDDVAVVESVKAAGDIKAPLSGTVIAINDRLADEPELVNSDPIGEGWFVKMKPENSDALENFMDEAAYKEFIESL